MIDRRAVLTQAIARLSQAGVPSPDHDAAELLAHVVGRSRGELALVAEIDDADRTVYDSLVERRAARVPLQHLTGSSAFRYLEVAVGPGVFVPRPETELLAGWAIEHAAALEAPIVLDLCTGSGVIAASIAGEVPDARVVAVELDPEAMSWAERNLAGTGIDLRQGDLADACPDLEGHVDVITCNPPYVPLEAWESVAPEARDHDPHLALFSGNDGLDAIRVLAVRATRLLKPGGVIGVEHADAQGISAPAVFAGSGHWTEVRDHLDLAGRPRFLTARLAR
ncbi:peptide chain release factor N(5)-glutamine methyltransferase [Nocardioides salsibiostraticola]